VNSISKNSRTPFHIACHLGNIELVKYLASKPETYLEIEDQEKNTPLHLAAMEGHTAVVTFLISEKKVDPICMNAEFKKPIDVTKDELI
jgi:ankyrin repeat protein